MGWDAETPIERTEWADWSSQDQFASWFCAACMGRLAPASASDVVCRRCGTSYPVVDGIPDLRWPRDSTRSIDRDLGDARNLVDASKGRELDAMVRRFFDRPEWSEATRAMRTRQTLESPRKLRPELEGWLRPCLSRDRPFVDVGCGIGGLLSAAAQLGYSGSGVDSCMTVLVIAKRMIASAGGRPVLACGYAESLPLRDGSVSAVTMYDVIEHVSDADRAISEADRVVRPGGHVAISTPNRFSMAAEPHVFLWGVGWLPRRLQRSYVRWRGRAYDGVRLLSTGEISRMLGSHDDLRYDLRVPPVPDDEIRHFGPRRAALARLYNRVATLKVSRGILLRVGPFFQVMARRSLDRSTGAPRTDR